MKDNNSRTTNTKRNIVTGLIQVIVSQILPFVVRTILIYRFGVDYLGLNSLFTSVLSVLSLMELGFGTAIVYSLYKPVAENDIPLVRAYLSYFRKIYRVIGMAILAIGLILMPFLKHVIKETALPGGLNIYACYLIFLSDTVISYLLFGYLTAIPTAYQRRDILSKVDIGMCLLQCMAKSVLLLVSDNFYLYLFSIPVVTVLRNIITRVIIRKKYPELVCKGSFCGSHKESVLSDAQTGLVQEGTLGDAQNGLVQEGTLGDAQNGLAQEGALSESQKHDLKIKVYGLLIGKITAVSRNSIDTLCISMFIGLTATGIYNNYYYILSGVIAFSTMILSSMMASVGNSIAVESREKNYNDMRRFDFIYTAIAGWATVCLLCLYQPFVKTWLGTDMMLETPVVIALCSYFYILKSGDIRWVYQESAGQWYECRFIMIGEAVANIVLNVLLCKIWGVFGIVLATVLSVFITNVFFCPKVLFSQYFKNGKLKEYLKDHVLYSATMLLSAGCSWFACESLLPIRDEGAVSNVLCLVGRLVICTLLSLIVFLLVNVGSDPMNKL